MCSLGRHFSTGLWKYSTFGFVLFPREKFLHRNIPDIPRETEGNSFASFCLLVQHDCGNITFVLNMSGTSDVWHAGASIQKYLVIISRSCGLYRKWNTSIYWERIIYEPYWKTEDVIEDAEAPNSQEIQFLHPRLKYGSHIGYSCLSENKYYYEDNQLIYNKKQYCESSKCH